MKNLTQYIHKTELAFFEYLKDQDLDALILSLREIEKHAKNNIGGKDAGLWFKFFRNDTGAHTIRDIEFDLLWNINRNYTIDNMKLACSLEGDLQVYYS